MEPSGEPQTDCVARIAAGDSRAFTELFTAYHPRLCSFAEKYLGSRDAAMEVVSDVFLWVWEHRAEWRVSGSVPKYLYGAVRNRSINRLQHERRVIRAHAASLARNRSPGMAEPPALPDAELDGRELAHLVQRTIDALPERAREAFLLQREHGLGYSEIAGVMEISVKTVEKHVGRAIRALREALGPALLVP